MFNTIFFSVLLFYGILVLLNIPAPFLGLKFEEEPAPRLSYQPPGFVIPIIWFALFTLLGIARANLLQTNEPGLQWWLFALAALCATYAYYTLGLAQLTGRPALWFGLWGNIAVILFATIVVLKVLPVSKTAAYLILPVIVWTAFATLLVIGQLKQQKLIG